MTKVSIRELKILDFLRESGPRTMNEISAGIGVGCFGVQSAIRRLRSTGVIVVTGERTNDRNQRSLLLDLAATKAVDA